MIRITSRGLCTFGCSFEQGEVTDRLTAAQEKALIDLGHAAKVKPARKPKPKAPPAPEE